MSPRPLQEWAAFIALVPYFSSRHAARKIGDRLQAVLRQCEKSILLRAGLSSFEVAKLAQRRQSFHAGKEWSITNAANFRIALEER